MSISSDVDYNLLVVLGPTASGKTRLGVSLARTLDGEIISADSRQVYRGMDIGTGKDLAEYGDVPHHLIDIVPPGSEFNLFEFQRRFHEAFAAIRGRGHLPQLVGGTGMYIEAAVRGYRLVEAPENLELRDKLAGLSMACLAERLKLTAGRLHNTTDLLERDRLVRAIEIAEYERDREPGPLPEIRPLVLGIIWRREELRLRITARLRERLAHGMIEEVERLHREGVQWESLEFYGLEYRFVARHLKGELNRNDMFQKLNSAIHSFARRQETWFRRMERNGTIIHWLDGAGDPFREAMEIIEAHNSLSIGHPVREGLSR
ncbi:MAG TPA: tRNA (adenosine(37)-N6)-dimethylallyltransferase MiaA [Geobacteraceae bacterium]|nr:tRNA (adenosine(37)-N6)-dimethylallyltransferase MiaA [Geobacteraceae bacterium]